MRGARAWLGPIAAGGRSRRSGTVGHAASYEADRARAGPRRLRAPFGSNLGARTRVRGEIRSCGVAGLSRGGAWRGETRAALIAVDLAAGWNSTCAVDQVGDVWCWGGLDGEASGAPRHVELGGAARAIAGSESGYCAVLVDGSTACFGPDFEGVVRSTFARRATSVVLSGYTRLVRLEDGSYVCSGRWGECDRVGSDRAPHEFSDGELACVSGYGVRPAPHGDCTESVAPDLLRRHDLTIAEVAERVGYGSASTFSTAFSRHVGQPPGRYARAARSRQHDGPPAPASGLTRRARRWLARRIDGLVSPAHGSL